MPTPLRLSPIHDRLQPLNGTWREIYRMPSLVAMPHERAIAQTLGIADFTFLQRFGVKGAGAAEWLANQGIAVSDRPNTWYPLPNGGIVARLGSNEFLIEDSPTRAIASQLAEACHEHSPKVYPVLRQDLAIALWGKAVDELMRQTCNVNFRALDLAQNPLVLTSMIGVTVIVIPSDFQGLPFYRIWCDGTFGNYFWQTLVAIVESLGGGIVGSDLLMLSD